MKKSKKIWLGQHPEWVLNAIIAYTDPNERFNAIWALVEDRSEVIYDQHAKAHDADDDTYVPVTYIDDMDSLLRALDDLPRRICEQAAASPCFAEEKINYAHYVEEDWAGWTVLIGNYGYIRLTIQIENCTTASWRFLVQRNDGYVVNAYKKGRYEENDCPLQDIRYDLEPLLTVQISDETYARLRRGM